MQPFLFKLPGFFLLTVSLIFLSLQALLAQPSGSIHGRVLTQEEKAPVELANVFLVGTRFHTMTDTEGAFTLQAPAGTYTLQISRVGMQKISQDIEIMAEKDTEINGLLMDSEAAMDEVTVFGKSVVQEIREQGFQVNALDLKVQQNTTADLNQVLNRTTGIRIREEGGLGSDFNFSLNGFSGNQVKFFLDGIPMDNFGSSLTLNNLPANIAERIEIYKGVVPVSLGTDALGGAINIVTRSNPNYLDASYSIGSFNTHRPALSAAYTSDQTGFTLRTNAFFNYSDNNYEVLVPIKNLETSSYEGEEAWQPRFHDRYQSATLQLEAGVTGKKYADQLLLGIIASGNDKQIQTGVVMEEVYGAMTSNSQTLVPSLKYKKADIFLKGLDFNLYSAYNINNFQLIDTTARIYNWRGDYIPSRSSSSSDVGGERNRTQNQNKNQEFLTTANLNYTLNDLQTIVFNYMLTDFHRTSYDVENPDAPSNRFPSDLHKQVVGLGWNLNIPDKWNTAVFGKFYAMKAVGYETVGSFTEDEREEAVMYQYQQPGYGIATNYFLTPAWQVKASYEHAYRLPESNEIFGDGIFVVYSPGLRPERSDNINLGTSYNQHIISDHSIGAEAGLIYRMTHDFIRVDQSVSGGNRRTMNKGKVQTSGFEAELRYAYKSLFFAAINGTYQRIIDKQEYEENTGFTGTKTKNFTYGFRLPNLPYLFANANMGVNLPLKGGDQGVISFNYTLNFVEKYYLTFAELGYSSSNERYVIPRQFAHNIFVTYSLKDNRYNITLECRNFTDNLLYDSYRLQKPGRSVSMKLRYYIHK